MPKRQYSTARIHAETYARLRAFAAERQCSISDAIDAVLERGLTCFDAHEDDERGALLDALRSTIRRELRQMIREGTG